ncbi:uncharacterized protein LOC128545860 [Mercenaria mercenaria]|uniref:uncharacterized protein LOC128545860 n=1 Tax=Mercenaria mercenaria TaxID=6596 RepID=UPI00234EC0E6|nr:uncharacterized protein LOC128545860 [Mercenaria mercenaria]
MVYKLFFGVLTVLCFTEVVNGIRCSYYDYDRAYSKVTKYKYCDSGCCGDMNNRYCCYSNVGLIIGISIGSILLVVTVVTVFVVICCCCKKSRGQPGQVFQPASVTTTVHGMQTIPPTLDSSMVHTHS